jgi:hypothetical protein
MSLAGVVKLSSLSDLRVLRVFAVRLKLVFFKTYKKSSASGKLIGFSHEM